jgi:hypothetical protein
MENSRNFNIRKPVPQDHGRLEYLARMFQENSLFSSAGFSPAKAAYWLTTGMDDTSDTFFRVIERDGEAVGIFLGYVSEYFFSNEKIACDLVVFIHPDHRQNAYRPLKQLFNDFEQWAISKGAIETCIATSSGTDGAGYKKFVLKQGYNEVGFVTKKRI